MSNFTFKLNKAIVAISCCLTLIAGCASSDSAQQSIRLLTHKDFYVPSEAFADFEVKTCIEVLVCGEVNSNTMGDLLERPVDNPASQLAELVQRLRDRHIARQLSRLTQQLARPNLSMDDQSRVMGERRDWLRRKAEPIAA